MVTFGCVVIASARANRCLKSKIYYPSISGPRLCLRKGIFFVEKRESQGKVLPTGKIDCTGQAGDQPKNVSGSWDPRPALAGWPITSHRNPRQHANDISDRAQERHCGGIESEASCVHKSFYICQGTLGTQDRACNPGPAWQDCHPACDPAYCFGIRLPSAISTLRASTHSLSRSCPLHHRMF